MAPEVCFNAAGVPYLVEFADVSFLTRAKTYPLPTRPRAGMQPTRPRAGMRPTPLSSLNLAPGALPSPRPFPAPAPKPMSTTAPSLEPSLSSLNMSNRDARSSQRSLLRTLSLPFRLPRRLRRRQSNASIESDWTHAALSPTSPTSPTSSEETLAGPPTPPKDKWLRDAALCTEPSTLSHCDDDSGYAEFADEREHAYEHEHQHADEDDEDDESICAAGEGLLIRFAGAHSPMPQLHPAVPRTGKFSASALVRLKCRIARAVAAAGMDASPHLAAPGLTDDAGLRASTLSVGSACAERIAQAGHPSALFRGTYGQVMAALDAAGLTAAPCSASGVRDATRLGALFVARQDARGGVVLTKLTLWA